MTCRELTSFIADYFSGELDAEIRNAFEYHLSLCPNCVQYVTDYERTIALGQRAYEEAAPVPGEVPEELVTAILASQRARRGI